MARLRVTSERWLNLSHWCYELHFLSFLSGHRCVHPFPPVRRTRFITWSAQMSAGQADAKLLKRRNDLTATHYSNDVYDNRKQKSITIQEANLTTPIYFKLLYRDQHQRISRRRVYRLLKIINKIICNASKEERAIDLYWYLDQTIIIEYFRFPVSKHRSNEPRKKASYLRL